MVLDLELNELGFTGVLFSFQLRDLVQELVLRLQIGFVSEANLSISNSLVNFDREYGRVFGRVFGGVLL